MSRAPRMHANELVVEPEVVRGLVIQQFPEWAGLPIRPVKSAGTVNALFRLGDDMVIRLPRLESGIAGVRHEHEWLPRMRTRVSVAVPEVMALGQPKDDYPWPWSIYRWINGGNPTPEDVASYEEFVADIGGFILDLQEVETMGAPAAYRGGPLVDWDEDVRKALVSLRGRIDVDAVTKAWEVALDAPGWNSAPVWVHSDLMPGNLLCRAGRLVGVIDFETSGIGDPACELMVAWNLLSSSGRQQLRGALSVDDSTWLRGQGWALAQALVALPYYWETNPVMVATAKYVLDQVLSET